MDSGCLRCRGEVVSQSGSGFERGGVPPLKAVLEQLDLLGEHVLPVLRKELALSSAATVGSPGKDTPDLSGHTPAPGVGPCGAVRVSVP